MQKYLYITGLSVLISLFTLPKSNAQFIEKYSIDGFFGGTSTHFDQSTTSRLDFMNYIDYYEEYVVDEEYLSFSTHLWLTHNWEADLEIGINDALAPSRFKLKGTKRFSDHWGVNAGLQSKQFFLTDIGLYYRKLPGYYVNSQGTTGYMQFYMWLTGPYTGIQYSVEKERITLRANFNAGLSFNNKEQLFVRLKEDGGNYLWAEEYNIHSTSAWWFSPEVYFSYAIVQMPEFQIGLRISANYFSTRKSISYDYAKYEWTMDHPGMTYEKLPSHLLQQVSCDFGIFIKRR